MEHAAVGNVLVWRCVHRGHLVFQVMGGHRTDEKDVRVREGELDWQFFG